MDLELPKDVKKQLRELEDLSKEVEAGNKEARKELRKLVRASSPEIVAECSDFARRAELMMVKFAAAGSPLTEEALPRHLENIRREFAGEEPTSLEALLSERIAACWLLTQLADGLMAAQLYERSRDKSEGAVPFSLPFQR